MSFSGRDDVSYLPLASNDSLDQQLIESPTKPRYKNQIILAAVICLGPIAMGCVLGYSSPAVPDMSHTIFLTDLQVSLVGSLPTLGALFGGLIAGALVDRLGRKLCILATCVPYVLGWTLIACAGRFGDSAIAALCTGRVVTGACVGVTCLATPLYLSEAASPDIRGILGAAFQLSVNVGILVAYGAGALMSWNYLAMGSALIPAMLAVAIVPLPESPAWLLRNGRRAEAVSGLKWLRGSNFNIEAECDAIAESLLQKTSRMSIARFLQPKLAKPFVIVLTAMALQQFSGINAVVFNARNIFAKASPTLDPNSAAIIVAAVMVAATFISVALIDKAGRRVLLALSAFCMAVSTIALGAYYYVQFTDPQSVNNLAWIPVVCLVAFVTAFNMGYGPIPWLLMSELFPAEARGIASAIATAFNWSLAFLVTSTFAGLTNTIHNHGAFWLFGAITAAGLVFVWKCVPETKGKTLQEIQEMFGRTSDTSDE